MIHKCGDVSQPQGRSEKNLSLISGDLPFVIESSQFHVVKWSTTNHKSQMANSMRASAGLAAAPIRPDSRFSDGRKFVSVLIKSSAKA
jgi:hypothetical protein